MGDRAPAFRLPGPHGEPVTLEELLGDGPLVVFFVPRPDTGVCAKTACGLRDNHAELKAAGAKVVGISPMSPRVHARLREDHRLPFLYLSDPEQGVARDYGVKPFLGLIAGRATFVLDSGGVIQWMERSQLSANRHIEAATRVIERSAGLPTGEGIR